MTIGDNVQLLSDVLNYKILFDSFHFFILENYVFLPPLYIFFSFHSKHFQKFYEKTGQRNGCKDFQVVTQQASVEEAALPALFCSRSVCLSFIH